jgi:hypothetical protein
MPLVLGALTLFNDGREAVLEVEVETILHAWKYTTALPAPATVS